MVTESFQEWTPVVFFVSTLVYIVFMHHLEKLEKRFRSGIPATDTECLAKMARMLECSEFDIFCASTGNWNVPKSKINEDFKSYLVQGHLPYYVRDFIRRNKKEIEKGGPDGIR